MAFQPGYNAVIKVDNSAGSLTNISAYCYDDSFPRSADELETTTFGQTAHRRIGGLTDGSFSISVRWDPTASTGPDAVLSGIIGLVGSVEYGPHGSTATFIKYTFEALCTGYEISGAVDGLVEATADFVIDGAVTRGTY